ncbi:hypothetical protein KKA08_05775, partial [bacterium]|nr:hypothetical protein [bacterium]
MTGRERVLAVLNREKADRIPFDIGATDCSSVHALPYLRLRQALALPDRPVVCGCLTQLIAEPDEDIVEALDVDVEGLYYGSRETKIWQTPFGVDLIVPAGFAVQDLPDGSSVVRTPQGDVCARRAAEAYYFDPAGNPLKDLSTPAELERFSALFERWDYPAVFDEPVDQLAERAKRRYAATTRAVVALWNLHYLQAGQIMRGFEQFLVDLMVDKEMARGIFDKLHDVYLRRVDMFMRHFGDAFDIVFLCDDLGTQQAGMISPALYREMLFPYFRELIARIKAHDKKIIMHSCGAVAEFIPHFIEMGV